MATFTSSLPDHLLQELSMQAKKLSVPKNKIIEKALKVYLNQIKRIEYINSYQQQSEDKNILAIAEEGMEEYLNQLLIDER
ncbi:MAG: ribbon-helix-helix domain-containing protein [Vicingaceae bacterium]